MHLSTASQLAGERGLLKGKEEMQLGRSGVTPGNHAGQRAAGDGTQVTATGIATCSPHLEGSLHSLPLARPFCPPSALRHCALTSLSYHQPLLTQLAAFLPPSRGLVLDDLQGSFCSDTLWPLEWQVQGLTGGTQGAFAHVSLGRVDVSAWVPWGLVRPALPQGSWPCLCPPLRLAWDSLGTEALWDFFLVCVAPGLTPRMDGMPDGWLGGGGAGLVSRWLGGGWADGRMHIFYLTP